VDVINRLVLSLLDVRAERRALIVVGRRLIRSGLFRHKLASGCWSICLDIVNRPNY
jgi:hypothetical protein